MKIVSGRIRFKGLLTKVQAIKYNAKHVSRGAFATAEELALQTNVNESMKRIDELQRKLLNWSEAQNYMQMGKHYVRQEAGGDELSEVEVNGAIAKNPDCRRLGADMPGVFYA